LKRGQSAHEKNNRDKHFLSSTIRIHISRFEKSMDTYLLIFIIAVIILLIIAPIMRLRTSESSTGSITLSDIPVLVDALKNHGEDGSFWFITIPDSALDDDYPAKLTLSLEGDNIGIDWTLLTQRNAQDLTRFMDLATQNGLKVRPGRKNKVKYMRLENAPDFAQFIQSILKNIYGVEESTPLPVVKIGINSKKE